MTFRVRRFSHQGSPYYGLVLTTQDRLVDMTAGKHDKEVTFYELTLGEMQELGEAIIAEAKRGSDVS